MNKVIFGFTGLLGSGKGNAAAYLEKKYGASTYRFSTMLRDALDRFHLPHTRDNLVKISEIMRETFGEDIMAKTMAHDVETDENPLIVVEGIRRMADITYLSKLPGFVLIEIVADPKIRYERLTKRGENSDDTTKTFAQFLEDHNRSTEQSILDVIQHAAGRIDNNGSIEELQTRLDELVKKYAGRD